VENCGKPVTNEEMAKNVVVEKGKFDSVLSRLVNSGPETHKAASPPGKPKATKKPAK
jgi:hypothetical protein